MPTLHLERPATLHRSRHDPRLTEPAPLRVRGGGRAATWSCSSRFRSWGPTSSASSRTSPDLAYFTGALAGAAVAGIVFRSAATGHPDGWRWWFEIGWRGLVLALSLLVSTTYHLGYPEYRDADLRSPLMGTVIADSAAVLTGHPVGAFVTHPAAHVSAVVHQEEGGPTQMLPPKVTGDYPSHGSQDVAAVLALVWLACAAGGITLLVRRERRTAA